jgi:thiamine phosphate synthase YjbQ (UPF0047 family)
VKSYRRVIELEVPARMGFVNITPQVEAALGESGVREGLCLVNSMHITSSVFVNDDEPGLHRDYARWLEWLASFDPRLIGDLLDGLVKQPFALAEVADEELDGSGADA